MAGSQARDPTSVPAEREEKRRGPAKAPNSWGLVLFVLKRIGQGGLTLALLSVLIFFATNALPGDAAEGRFGSIAR